MASERPPTDLDLALAIDPLRVTTCEAECLDRILRQLPRFALTPHQRDILGHLADQYLDPLLVAAWRGQQRLFITP